MCTQDFLTNMASHTDAYIFFLYIVNTFRVTHGSIELGGRNTCTVNNTCIQKSDPSTLTHSTNNEDLLNKKRKGDH